MAHPRALLAALPLRVSAVSIARAGSRIPLRAGTVGWTRHWAPLAAAGGREQLRRRWQQQQQQQSQVRWHSAGLPRSREVGFEDVKKIVESPDSDVVLVDVREPAEYAAGSIPTAINIPIASHPDALFLSPDEFQDRFGFAKPAATKEVVFYCKAGVRSSAAAQLARQGGYERVGEYRGSWLDWERRGGARSRDDVPGDKVGGTGESRV